MALRPERQAGRSRWRILIAVVVVAVLGSLTAVGVVYARRPHDRGATPLYIGAQAVRDPGSVIIGAAGDIACPPDPRRNRPNACGMESTAKVLEAIRPTRYSPLATTSTRAVRWPTSRAHTQTPGVRTALSPSPCRATTNMKPRRSGILRLLRQARR